MKDLCVCDHSYDSHDGPGQCFVCDCRNYRPDPKNSMNSINSKDSTEPSTITYTVRNPETGELEPG